MFYLQVGFDNHETGVTLKRSYFEWSRNDLCRKFESSRVNNEAFVQKFKELRSGSRQCLDSSSSSSASDVNLSQDCPAFQMITSTPLSGEASLVPKSSYKSSKRLLEPTVKIRDNVKKKKKTEKETEEAEDDKAFLSRLITEKKKIDGTLNIVKTSTCPHVRIRKSPEECSSDVFCE